MIKKTITYEDYNGVKRTEDFYFNINLAELTEMQLGEEGGYKEMVERVVAAQNGPQMLSMFKNFILTSYGEKSPDGKFFRKSQSIRDDFESTDAYSVLFIELTSDLKAGIDFFKGIFPADLAKEVEKLQAKGA